MVVVKFYVYFSKYDKEVSYNLIPAGYAYVVAAGEDYNDAALTALEIVGARPDSIVTDIIEDL